MIIKTRRFKLAKPISFTDDITITMAVDQSEITISNGTEIVSAKPVEEEKSDD